MQMIPGFRVAVLGVALAFVSLRGLWAWEPRFTAENRGVLWDYELAARPAADGYAGLVFVRPGGPPLDEGTPRETKFNGIYGGYYADAAVTTDVVNRARIHAGRPRLKQDAALGRAAQLLVREMMRQGWVGFAFPDGKDLAWALRRAGYKGKAERVSPVLHLSNDWVTGRPLAYSYPVGMLLGRFPRLGGDFRAIGCGSTQAASASAYRNMRLESGVVQVLLLARDESAAESRALFDNETLREDFAALVEVAPQLVLEWTADRPVRSGGLVVRASQLTSVPRVVGGRLPGGVRLVAGRFVGTPEKPGVYRARIEADFQRVNVAGNPEGGTGPATVEVTLRVMKAR